MNSKAKKKNEIYTGAKIGNWIVVDINNFEQKKGYKKILCQCQCINKTMKYVDERNLKYGSTKNCGKCAYKLISINDKFGEWTVLEDEREGMELILCECSCGNKTLVNKSNLKRGISTNCGCIKNHFAKNQYSEINNPDYNIVIGHKYNKWTVLEHVKTNSYLCECECIYHTRKVLKRYSLFSEKHKGCKKCRLLKHRIGETFNKLTIGEIDEEQTKLHNGRIYVHADCECGCHIITEQNAIVRGRATSCGCNKQTIKETDLIGNKYGKLTVINFAGRVRTKNGNKSDVKVKWLCRCDCGNEIIVSHGNLLAGHTNSCGCLGRSYGEVLIEKFLKKCSINYQREYTFDDCRNILPLRFDFAILDDNNLKCLIEFDGEQHYKPHSFSNNSTLSPQEKYEQACKNDEIKNNYCIDNNIPLLRIPYWELDENNLYHILWDYLVDLKLLKNIE